MLHCGNQTCRFRVIGSLLFFMVLFCPKFSRGAAPTTDAKLADIIKKARARRRDASCAGGLRFILQRAISPRYR
ncbi:MAG TPA: hypothetical protein VLJ79_29530 [Candidatus Binatia bacterium]|nr:hypothetical protein [Candidatus Binatia bacterium]